MVVHDTLSDRQAESAAGDRGSGTPIEFPEHLLAFVGGDAFAFVGDLNVDLTIDSRGRVFVADRGTAESRSSTRTETSSRNGSSSDGRAAS